MEKQSQLDLDEEFAKLMAEQEKFLASNQKPSARVFRKSPDSQPPPPPLEHCEKKKPVFLNEVQEKKTISPMENRSRFCLPPPEKEGFPIVKKLDKSIRQRKGKSLFSQQRELLKRQQALDSSCTVDGEEAKTQQKDTDTNGRGNTINQHENDAVIASCEYEENKRTLEAMSVMEIQQAQEELYSQLSPEVINMLKNRSSLKQVEKKRGVKQEVIGIQTGSSLEIHQIQSEEGLYEAIQTLEKEDQAQAEWITSTVKENGITENQDRVDFSGLVISKQKMGDFDGSSGLFHHGLNPDQPGYTFEELLMLCRSTVSSQRSMALQIIAKVLSRRQQNVREYILQNRHYKADDSKCATSIFPSKIPSKLALILRCCMDDQNSTVLGAAILAMHSFLVPQTFIHNLSNNFDCSFGTTLPPTTIKVHKDKDFVLDSFNKIVEIKTTEATENESPNNGSCGNENESALFRDEKILNTDPIAGLTRMSFLTRVGYLFEKLSLKSEVTLRQKLWEMLIMFACHSNISAFAILDCPKLYKLLEQTLSPCHFSDCDGEICKNEASIVHLSLVLVRVLCQSNVEIARKMESCGLLSQIKAFIALRELSCEIFELCQIEVFRIWRVCTNYNIDIDSFSILHPILCGYTTQSLYDASSSKPVMQWGVRPLCSIFKTLDSFCCTNSKQIANVEFFIAQATTFFTSNDLNSIFANEDLCSLAASALHFLASVCRNSIISSRTDGILRLLEETVLLFCSASSCIDLCKQQIGSYEGSSKRACNSIDFLLGLIRLSEVYVNLDEDHVRNLILDNIRPEISHILSSKLILDGILTKISSININEDWHFRQLALLVQFKSINFIQRTHVTNSSNSSSFVAMLLNSSLDLMLHLEQGNEYIALDLLTNTICNSSLLQTLYKEDVDLKQQTILLIQTYKQLILSQENDVDARKLLLHSRQHVNYILFNTEGSDIKFASHLFNLGGSMKISNLPLPSYWMFAVYSRLNVNSIEEDANQSLSLLVSVTKWILMLENLPRNENIVSQWNEQSTESKLFHFFHIFFLFTDISTSSSPSISSSDQNLSFVLFDPVLNELLSELFYFYIHKCKFQSNMKVILDSFDLYRTWEEVELKPAIQSNALLNMNSPISSSVISPLVDFVEKLVTGFTHNSYGNKLFAQVICFFFLSGFPSEVHTLLWRELRNAGQCHLIEPIENAMFIENCFSNSAHQHSINQKTIEQMKQFLVHRNDKEINCFLYKLALHHVCQYVLEGVVDSTSTISWARQQTLRTFLSEASNDVIMDLVSYKYENNANVNFSLTTPVKIEEDKLFLGRIEFIKKFAKSNNIQENLEAKLPSL